MPVQVNIHSHSIATEYYSSLTIAISQDNSQVCCWINWRTGGQLRPAAGEELDSLWTIDGVLCDPGGWGFIGERSMTSSLDLLDHTRLMGFTHKPTHSQTHSHMHTQVFVSKGLLDFSSLLQRLPFWAKMAACLSPQDSGNCKLAHACTCAHTYTVNKGYVM